MSTEFSYYQTRLSLRSLWLFALYRIILSDIIAIIFVFYPEYPFFGSLNPVLFQITIIIFTISTYLNAFIIISGLFSPINQASSMVFIDIVALTLLTFSSGGVVSGLGALIAISIAIGSVIISSRQSLALAAIAASLLLSQELYLQRQVTNISSQVSKAGILGLAYFAITILAYILSKRAWESEKKAILQKQELQKMAHLNEQIVQYMNSGVIVINQHDLVFLANKSALNLLNLKQPPGRIPLSYYSTSLAKLVERWRYSPIQSKQTIKPSFNSAIKLQVTIQGIGKKGGRSALLLLSDADQLTKQAQQLKLASLGQLTASIAHEIRNPLCSIGHAGQLLSESETLQSEDQRLLNIINNNVIRLNEVIENILQISRATEVKMEKSDLIQVITAFVEQFLISKQLNSNQFKLHFESQIQVLTNSQQIQQVLTILCDNALSHFNKDENELIIHISSYIDEQQYLIIKVCDNGTPINETLAEKIFEPFYSTKHTGTGLGLYIAKGLCEVNSVGLDYIKSSSGNCFTLSFHPSNIIKL